MKKAISDLFIWLRSFLSDPHSNGEKQKGSMKRLTALIMVIVFCFYYQRVTITFLEKIQNLSNADFVKLLQTSTNIIPDIPETWAFLIGGILAINVADFFIRKKSFKNDEK